MLTAMICRLIAPRPERMVEALTPIDAIAMRLREVPR
jgi:hypothetical protein